MKEREYVLAADKKTWMDETVISDTPNKITIIDPLSFIRAITNALDSLPVFDQFNVSRAGIEHLSKTMVHTVMTAIVNRRQAWRYGSDTDVEIHLINLRELIGFDIEAELREGIRWELSQPDNHHAANSMDMMLMEAARLLKQHMNPNPFVVHRLTQSRDLRTFNLEEYADWRVIQWTKSEQDKIASRHETI